jgi:hypothetical protein
LNGRRLDMRDVEAEGQMDVPNTVGYGVWGVSTSGGWMLIGQAAALKWIGMLPLLARPRPR